MQPVFGDRGCVEEMMAKRNEIIDRTEVDRDRPTKKSSNISRLIRETLCLRLNLGDEPEHFSAFTCREARSGVIAPDKRSWADTPALGKALEDVIEMLEFLVERQLLGTQTEVALRLWREQRVSEPVAPERHGENDHPAVTSADERVRPCY